MHHALVYVSNRLAVAALLLTETAVAADPTALLEGTWTTPFRSAGLGFSTQNTLTGHDNQLQMNVRVHHKSPLFGNLAELYTATMLYTISKTIDANQGLHEIDFVFVKIEQTPLNDATVVKNNGDAQCGFTDWKLGVAKDVTGIHCDDRDSDDLIPGAKKYSVVQVLGDKLRMGKDSSLTPEARSHELDSEPVYTKAEE